MLMSRQCHLSNKLEYKFLGCISVHYQSRMTSNGIAITPSHPPTVQAGNMGGGGWGGGDCLTRISRGVLSEMESPGPRNSGSGDIGYKFVDFRRPDLSSRAMD